MKKLFVLVAAVGTMMTSCKKAFFDINDNPNSATSASITPDLLLPQAMHETGRIMTQNYSQLFHWMGQWARGGDFGPNQETETYNITTTFGAGTWANWYNNLNDYNEIVKKTEGTTQNFYYGIARAMKTIGYMYLVDTYNNVPYSKAFNLSANITPGYDKGVDVYKGLFADLDAAMTALNSVTAGADAKIASADIMFGGSVTKWKKFVNTLRLRLILRLSQTSGIINVATEVAKISAEGYLGAGESASVTPGYLQDAGKQNPFWDAYKLSPVGIVVDKFNRANNYTLNALRTSGDIRYQYYYERALTPISGNTYYGYNFGQNLPNGDPFKSDNSSAVAGPGLAKSATQPQWILTSIESLFLQAEARQRGYITGNAQTTFQAGILESFNWLGVANAATEYANYMASPNQYNDWAGASNKLQLILTQKYFSTVGMVPFEIWTDYRRTGFPSNVPYTMAANAAANIPVRYRYPQREYDYNPANVAAEGDPSPIASKIFWDL
jgi:hypothetical protein